MNDGYDKFKINCMIGLFKPSNTPCGKTPAVGPFSVYKNDKVSMPISALKKRCKLT